MPFTVDNDQLNQTSEAMQRIMAKGQTPVVMLDPAKPPTVQIPHMEFPRILYKHPNEPFRKVLHRNHDHIVVHEETVQTEHMTMAVADQKELDQAITSGWTTKPYMPEPLPDPLAGLYDEKPNKRKSA